MSRDSRQRLRAWARRALGPVKPIERPTRPLVICPYCNSERVIADDLERLRREPAEVVDFNR